MNRLAYFLSFYLEFAGFFPKIAKPGAHQALGDGEDHRC
jgi:hypothetical protein